VSFLGELKRRNVFRVAGVYTVVGWLLVQVAATVEEAIALPAWFDAVVLSFLVIVFPIALIFAWAFELTPDGIKRTAAVAPGESITPQTGSKLDVMLILSFLVFAGALLVPRFLPSNEVPVAGDAVPPISKRAPKSCPLAPTMLRSQSYRLRISPKTVTANTLPMASRKKSSMYWPRRRA
jgi:hypothetical protein